MTSNQPSTFKRSLEITTGLLKISAIPLLLLWLADASLTISLTDQVAGLTPAEESTRWMLQGGLSLWGLFEGLMVLLILSWNLPKVTTLRPPAFKAEPFHEPYLGSLLAEYLRSLASVMLYLLMLLLPAFYRLCQLIFVPYIALFAKPYREGRYDALKLSTELTRGRLKLIMLVMFSLFVVNGAIELGPLANATLHLLPVRLTLLALSLLISVWSYSFLFVLFKDAMEEKQWS